MRQFLPLCAMIFSLAALPLYAEDGAAKQEEVRIDPRTGLRSVTVPWSAFTEATTDLRGKRFIYRAVLAEKQSKELSCTVAVQYFERGNREPIHESVFEITMKGRTARGFDVMPSLRIAERTFVAVPYDLWCPPDVEVLD